MQVLAVALPLVEHGTTGGAFTGGEMVAITYMIFLYTPLLVLSQRGAAVRYWVNWILQGGKEEHVKGVRRRVRFNIVVGVGMQLLAYALVLMFWLSLYKDMSCSENSTEYVFFFYRFEAYGVARWIMVALSGIYALVLFYWLIETVRNVYVSQKHAAWCQDMLKVLKGAKQEAHLAKNVGPRGTFAGALTAVIDLGDGRAQEKYGARPTTAVTKRALAVEELIDGARIQTKVVSAVLLVWVVCVALALEFVLRWNKFDDEMSLTTYDQLLPCIVGLWMLMQSVLPVDESSVDPDQAMRHVSAWCDTGNAETALVEAMRTNGSRGGSSGELTRSFLRHFV